MVLMGDSNGSMYGKMAKKIAQGLGRQLEVISVAAGDPLPHSSSPNSQLWLDSLALVKRENPDVLLLVCNWESKLKGEKGRLDIAINELKEHTRHLILITQPPELPKSAERESIRNGGRPPFREDPAERAARTESNTFLKSFQRDNVIVIDIEPLFAEGDGSIRFIDDSGVLLYQDRSHLSDVGADLVKADVIRAISELEMP
jgi:ribosomal protein L21E